MEEKEPIRLDYTLKTPQERSALVQTIIDNAAPNQLTDKYLEILSDYILDAALTKEEKRARHITTSNRQLTIDKRETSYEELVSKLENGEDGIYNLINNDKNQYLTARLEISADDLAEIPGLTELQDQIAAIEVQAQRATGKRKYLLKKQVIEMRQQQYILKELWRQPHRASTASNSSGNPIELSDHIHLDENGDPVSDCAVSLFEAAHIRAILSNFELLDTRLAHKYNSDFHYLMRDFKALMAEGLDPYPIYREIARAKIEGQTNAQISDQLARQFNIQYSPTRISAIWRNKIPKMLADLAKTKYLEWYYTEVEYGAWKRCSCCGKVKLAHHYFFTRNPDSKDGFYSICKECRKGKAQAQRAANQN